MKQPMRKQMEHHGPIGGLVRPQTTRRNKYCWPAQNLQQIWKKSPVPLFPVETKAQPEVRIKSEKHQQKHSVINDSS